MLQIGTEADDPAGERMIGFPPAMGAPGTLNDLAAMHVLTTSTLAAVEVSRATDGPLANVMAAMAPALESESRT